MVFAKEKIIIWTKNKMQFSQKQKWIFVRCAQKLRPLTCRAGTKRKRPTFFKAGLSQEEKREADALSERSDSAGNNQPVVTVISPVVLWRARGTLPGRETVLPQ